MLSKSVSFTIRQSLGGNSLIGDLLREAHYSASSPSREFLEYCYTRMVRASRRDDLKELYRDTISLVSEKQLRLFSVDIDMTNLQFFGAALYEARWAFGYEPDILSLIELYLPKDGCFIDVGCNWGYFPIHILLNPTFTGHVVGLDPIYNNLKELKRILKIVDLDDRATLIPVAAGDVTGSLPITDHPLSGSNSLVDAPLDGEQVRVVRLDDLKLPKPDFVKIDVENFEDKVLCGMSNLLSESKPMIVFENWLDPNDTKIHLRPMEILIDNGYHLYAPHFEPQARYSSIIPFDANGILNLTPIDPHSRSRHPIRLNILASSVMLD